MTLKVVGQDTGGAFALAEFDAPPGYAGPPPHRHQETDEAFYVLQGEFRLQVEGETVRAGPGAFVFVPRGVRHTYANPGPDPARLLLLLSPAGFERYFLDLSAAVAAGGGTAPPEALAAVFARHGVVVDSPPGAPTDSQADGPMDGPAGQRRARG
jgi:quercetin dioxygenase-like cupin family protein